MARAYAYVLGNAPLPAEVAIATAIEQFGVKAVTGKDVLSRAEINGIKNASAIVRLGREREQSGAWAEWEQKHPKEAAVLAAAHRIWQTQSK